MSENANKFYLVELNGRYWLRRCGGKKASDCHWFKPGGAQALNLNAARSISADIPGSRIVEAMTLRPIER